MLNLRTYDTKLTPTVKMLRFVFSFFFDKEVKFCRNTNIANLERQLRVAQDEVEMLKSSHKANKNAFVIFKVYNPTLYYWFFCLLVCYMRYILENDRLLIM